MIASRRKKSEMTMLQKALIITSCVILALVFGGLILQLISPAPTTVSGDTRPSATPSIRSVSNDQTTTISIVPVGKQQRVTNFERTFDTPLIQSLVTTSSPMLIRLFLATGHVDVPLDGSLVDVYDIKIRYAGLNEKGVALQATGPLPAKP